MSRQTEHTDAPFFLIPDGDDDHDDDHDDDDDDDDDDEHTNASFFLPSLRFLLICVIMMSDNNYDN